jgi:hypothetical protein
MYTESKPHKLCCDRKGERWKGALAAGALEGEEPVPANTDARVEDLFKVPSEAHEDKPFDDKDDPHNAHAIVKAVDVLELHASSAVVHSSFGKFCKLPDAAAQRRTVKSEHADSSPA